MSRIKGWDLGSVASPVIQANGRLTFDDDLRSAMNQRLHWACQQYGHSGGTQGWLGVNFACRIHPAAQSDISEQQWVTGFHCV